MIISLSDADVIKNDISEQFDITVHFHDGCGGQYFTLENAANEEVKNNINNYFTQKYRSVVFSENKTHFRIKDPKTHCDF